MIIMKNMINSQSSNQNGVMDRPLLILEIIENFV